MIPRRAPAVLDAPMALRGAALIVALSVTSAAGLARGPAELSFTVKYSRGASIRFLQFVHERPLHLIVVSADLSSFDHIHPELGVGDAYRVTHAFAHGGAY